jgi:hypothetical protein
MVWIRGSGSVPKFHGSATLAGTITTWTSRTATADLELSAVLPGEEKVGGEDGEELSVELGVGLSCKQGGTLNPHRTFLICQVTKNAFCGCWPLKGMTKRVNIFSCNEYCRAKCAKSFYPNNVYGIYAGRTVMVLRLIPVLPGLIPQSNKAKAKTCRLRKLKEIFSTVYNYISWRKLREGTPPPPPPNRKNKYDI